jgi:hypothetical protein
MLSTTLKRMTAEKLGDLAVAGIVVVALPPLLYMKTVIVAYASIVNVVKPVVHAAEKVAISFWLDPTATDR